MNTGQLREASYALKHGICGLAAVPSSHERMLGPMHAKGQIVIGMKLDNEQLKDTGWAWEVVKRHVDEIAQNVFL